MSAAFGVSAELVGSVFYGAATLDRSATVIPMVSCRRGSGSTTRCCRDRYSRATAAPPRARRAFFCTAPPP